MGDEGRQRRWAGFSSFFTPLRPSTMDDRFHGSQPSVYIAASKTVVARCVFTRTHKGTHKFRVRKNKETEIERTACEKTQKTETSRSCAATDRRIVPVDSSDHYACPPLLFVQAKQQAVRSRPLVLLDYPLNGVRDCFCFREANRERGGGVLRATIASSVRRTLRRYP